MGCFVRSIPVFLVFLCALGGPPAGSSAAAQASASAAEAAAQTTANPAFPLTDGSANAPVHAPTSNHVENAAQYSGSDCGQKIAAAITAAGRTPITVQVNDSCGTSAWSAFTLPQNDNLQFSGGGSYLVKGITLSGNNSIYTDNRAAVILEPNSATQSCILCGTGTSSARLYYIDIHHISFLNQFCAPSGSGCTTPVAGSSAIHLTYVADSFIQENRFLNFDSSVSLTHADYVFIDHNYFNGGTTQNLYVNGDGPLYVINNLLNGSFSGNGATLVNVGSAKVSMNDAVRNKEYGLSITAAAALPNGGAADIEVTQNTLDSNGNSGLYLNQCWECVVTHNWASSGRAAGKSGISANNIADSVISFNKVYWSGIDGIDVNKGTSVALNGNVIGATSGVGINLISTKDSTASNNVCNSTLYGGSGAGMSFCIFEQGSSGNNVFVGNQAQGMATANWAFQSSSVALNGDGKMYGPVVNNGTFAEGANGTAYIMRQKVDQTTHLIRSCAASTTCSATITFPKAFPNTAWRMKCAINGTSSGVGVVASEADPTSTTQATVNVYALSGPLTVTEITCEGFE
jgi:hypothetical protein